MTDQTLKNTFQIQPVYASRQQWEALASQEVHQIDGKHVQDKALYGGITAVGADCAILETDTEMEIFDNLEIDAGGQLLCKVVEKREQGYLVLYTSIPSGYRRWIRPFKT